MDSESAKQSMTLLPVADTEVYRLHLLPSQAPLSILKSNCVHNSKNNRSKSFSSESRELWKAERERMCVNECVRARVCQCMCACAHAYVCVCVNRK